MPEAGEVTERENIVAGTAGASARREGERRSANRVTRIRDDHPHLGGLILALSEDPQSTKAWATGAEGEERVGRQLDKLVPRGIQVLHDRRVGRGRGNIDHLAVGPSGVFVLDAKKYAGRPSLRVDDGWFRPRVEKLTVGSRDQTHLVEGVHKQVDEVNAVLDVEGVADIPVMGMLCFVDAEWPLFGGDFVIDGVRVLWPRKAGEVVLRPGGLDAAKIEAVARVLHEEFPSA